MKSLINHLRVMLLLLLLIAVSNCKKPEEITYSVINGVIENKGNAKNILLAGKEFTHNIPISKDGTFTDTLNIKGAELYSLRSSIGSIELYLEEGKNLSISVDAKKFNESLVFSGDLIEENNFLVSEGIAQETNMMKLLPLFKLSENEFLSQVNKNKKVSDSLIATVKINNKVFINFLKDDRKYVYNALIEQYQGLHSYLTGNKKYKVSTNFYTNLIKLSYKDTIAFRKSSAYQGLLRDHYLRLVQESSDTLDHYNSIIPFLKLIDSELPNGFAKNELMFNQLSMSLKPNEFLEQAFLIYKNSSPDSENLTSITEIYNKFQKMSSGNISPEFAYENYNGGTTNLKDLKGKYVYIDIWATWCSPCIKEFPFIKALQKDYKNNNIEFVGISTDAKKNYDKWKTMIIDNNLEGTQLFEGLSMKSEFMSSYDVKRIPRFILIDPEGKIISADALRPSDPKLKTVLDNLLKKQKLNTH